VGDLTLTLVPTPWAVDIEVEIFPIFVAVVFTGIESHSLLLDITIAQYFAKNVLLIPLLGPKDIVVI